MTRILTLCWISVIFYISKRILFVFLRNRTLLGVFRVNGRITFNYAISRIVKNSLQIILLSKIFGTTTFLDNIGCSIFTAAQNFSKISATPSFCSVYTNYSKTWFLLSLCTFQIEVFYFIIIKKTNSHHRYFINILFQL